MNIEGRAGAESMQSAEQVSHVGIPGWGVDRKLKDRPGVPKEAAPHLLPGAHGQEAERQVATAPVLKRAELDELTPVFGTAQPPRGLSGALRRAAYRMPDHLIRHWAMLILADRVDVMEGRLLRALQGRRRRA